MTALASLASLQPISRVRLAPVSLMPVSLKSGAVDL